MMYAIKIMIFSILFFILIFATTYFAMQRIADQPSSSCLDCAYLKDTFFFSFPSLVLMPFVLFIMKKIKINKLLFSIGIAALFVIMAFTIDLNVFKDRVSSWSSYSIEDEVIATLFQSYLYTLTGGGLVFIIFYEFYKTGKKR